MLWCGTSSALAYSIPSVNNRYVNDFANLITSEAEIAIETNAKRLYEKHDEAPQVMVVTLSSIQNNDIKDYAKEMYNTYGIGKKDVNVGVLILVALQERRIRVATGRGTSQYISDEKATEFAELGASYFKNGQYSDGILAVQEAVIQQLDTGLMAKKPQVYEAEDISVVMPSETQEISENNKEVPEMKIQWSVILAGAFGILSIWQGIYTHKEAKNYEQLLLKSKNEYDKKDVECRGLRSELASVKRNLQKTSNELEDYERKFKIACSLDETLKDKINLYIANEFDEKVKSFLEHYEKVRNRSDVGFDVQSGYDKLMQYFEKLTFEQKQRVTMVGEARSFYQEWKKQNDIKLSKNEERNIRFVLNKIQKVSARDARTLEYAKRRYDNLSREARVYFDPTLHALLLKMYNSAKALQEEEEREERKRKSSSTSSSSNSFYDTSSYDYGSFSAGDGGCSDGGGGDAGW